MENGSEEFLDAAADCEHDTKGNLFAAFNIKFLPSLSYRIQGSLESATGPLSLECPCTKCDETTGLFSQ